VNEAAVDALALQRVRVPAAGDLERVLRGMRVDMGLDEGWNFTVEGRELVVTMTPALDARLEVLMRDLGRLRWGYEPGRMVQMVLPGVVEPWK